MRNSKPCLRNSLFKSIEISNLFNTELKMLGIKQLTIFCILIYNVSLCMACEMTIEEVDQCAMNGMFFGNRNTIIPSNQIELDQHCSAVRDSIKCIRYFTSTCLKGRIRKLFKIGIKNNAKLLNKMCNDPKERTELLWHLKCLLPTGNIEPFHICSDKSLVMMQRLKDIPAVDRVPVSCCIFQFTKQCILQNSKAICGRQTSHYWDQVISQAEDSMPFSCANYETVEKCDEFLNPRIWDELKSLADSDDPRILAQRRKFGSGLAIVLYNLSF